MGLPLDSNYHPAGDFLVSVRPGTATTTTTTTSNGFGFHAVGTAGWREARGGIEAGGVAEGEERLMGTEYWVGVERTEPGRRSNVVPVHLSSREQKRLPRGGAWGVVDETGWR